VNDKIEILEDLESKRRTYLLGFIVFFGMWQLGILGTWYLKEIIPNSVFIVFGVFLLLGSFGWVWVSFLLLKITKIFKKNPGLCQVVNDERVNSLRYKASHYGLMVTMGLSFTIAVLFLLGNAWFGIDFSIFTGQFIAHLIWVVTLMSSVIAYYNLSKDE
jgi:fatty acid desaturase